MLLFLRETWELFWWAMFCPSRLQQRMNEWLPQEEKNGRRQNTDFFDILFLGNFRFTTQYLLLLFISNIPLFLKLIEHNQLLDWLQLPCVMLIAYATGVFFLPLGLVIPLLWLIVVLNQPDSWLKGLIEAIKVLPFLAQIVGLAVFGVSISLTVWLMQLLKKHLSLTRNVMVVGGTINVMLGTWLVTQNWLFLLLVSGITGFLLFLAIESIKNSDNAVVMAVIVVIGMMVIVQGVVGEVVAVAVAVGVGGVLVVGVVGVVAVGVVGVVEGVATLPLTWFSVVASLIAFALAPAKDNTVLMTTTVILIALCALNLGWLSALMIAVTLVSYYRIFPDYSFIFLGGYYTSPNSLLKLFRFSDSTIRWLRPQTAKILFQLPPYTSELLWIPLPNHAQLLVSEFRERPQQALTIFQYTQTFSLPGFQITLQNALPQIVADQLKQIQSIPELIFTANSNHPILPFLISPFYHLDSDSDTPTPETPLPRVKSELSILLPRLQTIIQDIQSALENENLHLRERGLEKINNKLVRLQSQLSSLGLKDEAIKRWAPVLEHWQRVIELEQNEQRKLSEGELINPFQYGNPVRLEQKNLFKGRQKFANEIVRRVLDRDRPTLVLHGPRRCGKTSFLYNFPRLLPSDILPVFVDMQSSAITTSESDFCFGLVRAIHKDCKSQGVQLPNIPKRTDFPASPYTTLEDWLDEALAQIGERRILLNLDEFEKIGTAIQKGQITLRLFDELRHLIQHYEQLGFLFSGVQTLEELGPNWSSYFISVVPIEMLYLEPNEAEDLLLNPDPAFTLRYAPGIVKEVLMLTNCHPYCLQLLGASMVNQANLNHTDFITAELLEASINDGFIYGQPYFTNIWTEFTGTTPEEIVIGQELLLQVARTDILLPITTEIAEKVLTRLLRYHILQKTNGGYDFEIPLLKQWVRERAVRS
ncbi:MULTISPECIES: AAA family ATPase [Nostoc]|uniref:AAA family ATPase n=1 Tax=Nostoc TaxID=1177 RepID=UPI0018F01617|nr:MULTISPECIES: AAA family ATPase [Nostoc]